MSGGVSPTRWLSTVIGDASSLWIGGIIVARLSDCMIGVALRRSRAPSPKAVAPAMGYSNLTGLLLRCSDPVPPPSSSTAPAQSLLPRRRDNSSALKSTRKALPLRLCR
jgi:hypothetical protein